MACARLVAQRNVGAKRHEVKHDVVEQQEVDVVAHHVVVALEGVSDHVQVVESMLDTRGVRGARVLDQQARARQWQWQARPPIGVGHSSPKRFVSAGEASVGSRANCSR